MLTLGELIDLAADNDLPMDTKIAFTAESVIYTDTLLEIDDVFGERRIIIEAD